MTFSRVLTAIFALSIHPIVYGNEFNHPGGLATLNIEKVSNQIPQIRYGTREPAIVDLGSQWLVLIGIGLNHLPGEYLVYHRNQGVDTEATFHRFMIKHTPFATKRIEEAAAKAPRLPNSLSDLDFDNTTPLSLPLDLPANGEWDQGFGSYLLDSSSEEATQQNFTYVTLPSNTPIKAPSNGIVSNINESKGTDKHSLTIDHGSGLYSVFNGLGVISVKLGHGLTAGEVFGYTPSMDKSDVTDSQDFSDKSHTIFWRTLLNNQLINPLILTYQELVPAT